MKEIHPKRLVREKRIKDRLKEKSHIHKKAHPFSKVVKVIFDTMGLTALGFRNTQRIACKHIELSHPKIGKEFNDFKIMFISDFHLNGNPSLIKPIKKILRKESVDIYLLGGDYQVNAFGNYTVIKSLYTELFNVIDTSKVYAVLGNHDEYKIAEILNDLGVNMLLNEFITIKRGDESIIITGIDDSDRYYSHEFPSLPKKINDYKILLTHSPNIYKEAEKEGYDLLLAGHTHSGQICYPGGIPIVRFTKFPHKYSYSLWKYKTMQGYTTAGVGNTWVNVRFFCPPEIVIITLKPK
ncbi:metallophosphoesterase [bacterium]|nr:metallophosphoesterase [bacterium]